MQEAWAKMAAEGGVTLARLEHLPDVNISSEVGLGVKTYQTRGKHLQYATKTQRWMVSKPLTGVLLTSKRIVGLGWCPAQHQTSAEFGSTIRLQAADEKLPRKGTNSVSQPSPGSYPWIMFSRGASPWAMHGLHRDRLSAVFSIQSIQKGDAIRGRRHTLHGGSHVYRSAPLRRGSCWSLGSGSQKILDGCRDRVDGRSVHTESRCPGDIPW